MVLSLLVGLAACSWRGEGLLEHTPTGPVLVSSTDKRFRLVHGPEAAALRGLAGYRVILEGRRVGGALRVTRWEIPEGLHGMSVFVGRLERRGVQLGVSDHNSGGFYLLDPASWPDLQGSVGHLVAIEGYVDGPHRVKVLHAQTLD